MSNRVGRIHTVTEEFFEVSIPRYGLILFKRTNQAVERLVSGSEIVSTVLFSATNTGCTASPLYIDSNSSRHQASSFRLSCGSSISSPRVVSPTAKRVDVVEFLVQSLRQQKADHLKVLVVMSRQPARISLGLGQRVADRLRSHCFT